MLKNFLIAGLCDINYYNYIGKWCLPTWKNVDCDKILLTDDIDFVNEHSIKSIQYDDVINFQCNFITNLCNKRKPINFWKKMQCQIWTFKRYQKEYDFILFLDADIEIVNFNQEIFKEIISKFKSQNNVWALGMSNDNGLDAGVFMINCKHPNLDDLIFDYEQVWESGKILELHRPYDGEAVAYTCKKYQHSIITNKNLGKGQHFYNWGGFHWGGKESKLFRSTLQNSKEYIDGLVCMD